jgi:hypothetical protein
MELDDCERLKERRRGNIEMSLDCYDAVRQKHGSPWHRGTGNINMRVSEKCNTHPISVSAFTDELLPHMAAIQQARILLSHPKNHAANDSTRNGS